MTVLSMVLLLVAISLRVVLGPLVLVGDGLQILRIFQDIDGVLGFVGLVEEQMAEVVADVVRQLLAVEALVDGLVVVQRVAWQMVQLSERVLALEQPLHLEVGKQTELHHFVVLGLVLVHLLEDVRLVALARYGLHAANALETEGFVDAEQENDVVAVLEVLNEQLGRPLGGCPHLVLHGHLDVLGRIRLQDEELGLALEHAWGLLDLVQYLALLRVVWWSVVVVVV